MEFLNSWIVFNHERRILRLTAQVHCKFQVSWLNFNTPSLVNADVILSCTHSLICLLVMCLFLKLKRLPCEDVHPSDKMLAIDIKASIVLFRAPLLKRFNSCPHHFIVKNTTKGVENVYIVFLHLDIHSSCKGSAFPQAFRVIINKKYILF